MGDQGIERRSALGLVEVGDRGRVGGIGAEAVDGLVRERDQAPRSKEGYPVDYFPIADQECD